MFNEKTVNTPEKGIRWCLGVEAAENSGTEFLTVKPERAACFNICISNELRDAAGACSYCHC